LFVVFACSFGALCYHYHCDIHYVSKMYHRRSFAGVSFPVTEILFLCCYMVFCGVGNVQTTVVVGNPAANIS